ncbi:hypothetical protein SAMN04487948_102233 [Halogranum amylolyticum]|uniref:PH domain-containing protein n=1 Tax=Halogranum amylolyticum TaxID=660520 RepID=A0A1H8PDR5_9EURY|nr:hypothetical protein [Halogranum amylolyticum]SEO39778.1 hypothetical protein SAMN04487948_102233 [Halogranum amylolyticum]
MKSETVYREVQRFRQPSLWLLVVATASVFLAFGVSEAQTLAARLLCVAVAVVLVVGFGATRLTTEVTDEEVTVSFPPFTHRKRISLDEIRHVERHVYRPATPLGHWGVHVGLGSPRSYNVSGEEGVELVYGENRRLVVGSRRPEELVDAVRRLQR